MVLLARAVTSIVGTIVVSKGGFVLLHVTLLRYSTTVALGSPREIDVVAGGTNPILFLRISTSSIVSTVERPGIPAWSFFSFLSMFTLRAFFTLLLRSNNNSGADE